MLIFEIQMFILVHFTNLLAQNAAKEHMTKHHPQKPVSNNTRSVVKGAALNMRNPNTKEANRKVHRIATVFH